MLRKTLTSLFVALTTCVALSGCTAADTSGDGAPSDPGGRNSEAKANYTTAQNNAIDSAKQYLSMGSGFSRLELIDQLSSKAGDGYKRKDAVFAVNHIKVNYRKQAVLAAKGYLELGGMSRAGLIEQLTSKAGSRFTPAQANYAADKVGL